MGLSVFEGSECLHISVPGALGYQKRVSKPLELVLQMVMSYHESAENQTQSSERAACALNHGTITALCLQSSVSQPVGRDPLGLEEPFTGVT